jgi:hypothetical protein
VTGDDCYVMTAHVRDVEHLEDITDRFAALGSTRRRSPSRLPRRAGRSTSADAIEDALGARVLHNRASDAVVIGGVDPVPRAPELEHPRREDLLHQRLPVGEREHRVGRPVDHERRRGDRRQRFAPSLSVVNEVVIAHRREVPCPLDLATDERTRARLVERPLAAASTREYPAR